MGHQQLEAGAQVDMKEGFVIGTDVPLDDPRVIAGWPQDCPNQWPADMPDWRATLEGYHASLVQLGHKLMSALALSLDVSENYFRWVPPFLCHAAPGCTIRRSPPMRQPTRAAPAPIPIGARSPSCFRTASGVAGP